MALRIIITGGTFDKQYDAIRGQLTFKDSHLPEIIERVRSTLGVELEINQLVRCSSTCRTITASASSPLVGARRKTTSSSPTGPTR